MKILTTGGAGFIGSHTCVELLNAGHEVVIVDNFVNSQKEAVKRVEELTYGQLDGDEYKKLKPCPLCAAPPRIETILAINETYAEGGDHDPVMTEARKNCPRKLKGK